MCSHSQALLFLGFFASVIGFLFWYARRIVRRAGAECVGSYDWWVFIDRDTGRNLERTTQMLVMNGVDERDVTPILLYRARYRRVSLAVFLLAGLIWIGIGDLVRPLCA